jgi:hypothetical protein
MIKGQAKDFQGNGGGSPEGKRGREGGRDRQRERRGQTEIGREKEI